MVNQRRIVGNPSRMLPTLTAFTAMALNGFRMGRRRFDQFPKFVRTVCHKRRYDSVFPRGSGIFR